MLTLLTLRAYTPPMTQNTALGMADYDADYDAPEVPRKGVSAEQQAVIVGLDDLDAAEKAKALDTLSDVATGDYYWPLADLDEAMQHYGLAKGSDGLWHDAMVLIDPEHPENGYEFDPSSVR